MKGKVPKFKRRKFARNVKHIKGKPNQTSREAAFKSIPRIEEMDARILNNLIVGVRRMIVYVPSEECDKLVNDHLNNLFRIVHVAPIGVGIQALTLLFQILQGKSTSGVYRFSLCCHLFLFEHRSYPLPALHVGDRLYRALYARMAAPDLLTSSKLPLMVSVVFKVLAAFLSNPSADLHSSRTVSILAHPFSVLQVHS